MNTTLALQLVLLTSFTLVGLLLSIRSPWHGFLLCVITLPLEAAFVAEVGFTIRLSYVALAVTLLSLLINTQRMISHSSLDSFVAAYVLVAGLSMGMTLVYPPPDVALDASMRYRGSEFRPLIQWCLLLLFAAGYFLAVHFCSNMRRLTTTVRIHVIVASVVALYGIYQFFASYYHLPFLDITYATGKSTNAALGSIGFFRSHATFREPAEFGHYLLSVAPISLALYAHKRGVSRVHSEEGDLRISVNFLQGAILLVALFFAGSRGAWFGFGLGLLAIVILAGKKVASPTIVLLTVALAVTISFFIAYLASGEMFRAGYSRVSVAMLRANVDRWEYTRFALDFWINRPVIWLFGAGIGNFPLHAAAHFGSGMISGPYSLPLQILAETGLLGLAAFLMLIVRAYAILLEALKLTRGTVWEAYFIGYIATLTALFGHHIVFADRVPLYVWILLGCSIGTVKAMMSARALGENMASET